MSAQLQVSIAYRPPVAVLALMGELDLATADVLAASAADLIGRGHVNLVVDTSGLRFCDSSGLEAICEAGERATRAGGSMRLLAVRGTLERVLEITRPEHRFRPEGGEGTWAATAADPAQRWRPAGTPRAHGRTAAGRFTGRGPLTARVTAGR
ncbi:anti-sigma factor antagonist [Sphaerisporangium melleum]|uniref:Anti-sigma factor antagonist n=1 Tax=Sphaerisporangium melleum TaxID=321316 RepID=A0A917VRW4_9ACTN|nr:STAS domain-containing protein [Sphaerisporangium melleum]GGL08368.1 anti-sigma factor antagonist [Sphaerisporangium melleum]GII74342.1 anti-sigma factor antagonist [Sphaerisporangium melleum]